MSFFRVPGLLAVLTALVCGPASAELLKYEFVGAAKEATFFIDTLKLPSAMNDRPPLGMFEYYGVQGTILEDGVMRPATFTAAFFNSFQHGGLDLYSTVRSGSSGWEPDDRFFASTDIVSSDPQAALFSGPVSRPELLKGSFVLKDWFDFSGDPLNTYSLTVTAVPESSTWASMALGLGALAWCRRRRTVTGVQGLRVG